LFAETIAGPESFEFVQAYCIDNMVVQAAQARVRVEIVSAGQQRVERLVEFLAGLAQMAGLEILLACSNAAWLSAVSRSSASGD